MEVKGTYNSALLHGDGEQGSTDQFVALCNQSYMKGEDIFGMPDRHWGAGQVSIGTVATLKNRSVAPMWVGKDIACGMLTVRLNNTSLDFEQMNAAIRRSVPLGMNVNKSKDPFRPLDGLTCYEYVNIGRALLSLGTLGGGRQDCHQLV